METHLQDGDGTENTENHLDEASAEHTRQVYLLSPRHLRLVDHLRSVSRPFLLFLRGGRRTDIGIDINRKDVNVLIAITYIVCTRETAGMQLSMAFRLAFKHWLRPSISCQIYSAARA